jgi:hypothetical protein
MSRSAVRVNDPVKGKEVFAGVIDGTTFYRTVDPEKHLLRTRQAYALQDSVIDKLVDKGVETIVIQEPTRRLVSTIEDWQEMGQDYDGPHGMQRTLSVGLMATL